MIPINVFNNNFTLSSRSAGWGRLEADNERFPLHAAGSPWILLLCLNVFVVKVGECVSVGLYQQKMPLKWFR